MWWMILVLCVALLFWVKHIVKQRAVRFVRSYEFLCQVKDGAEPSSANGAAQMLFSKHSTPYADELAILKASEFAKHNTGGKQLPIIAEARMRGFAD